MAKVTIAGARVSCGLSQQELADKMGVSRATVTNWERNKRTMRMPYLLLFCQITGFNKDDILVPVKSTKSRQEEEA